MNEEEFREQMRQGALICHCADGFYFIDTAPGIPLEKQAKDNGERNAHIQFITTVFMEPLWERDSNWPDTIDESNRPTGGTKGE